MLEKTLQKMASETRKQTWKQRQKWEFVLMIITLYIFL